MTLQEGRLFTEKVSRKVRKRVARVARKALEDLERTLKTDGLTGEWAKDFKIVCDQLRRDFRVTTDVEETTPAAEETPAAKPSIEGLRIVSENEEVA